MSKCRFVNGKGMENENGHLGKTAGGHTGEIGVTINCSAELHSNKEAL